MISTHWLEKRRPHWNRLEALLEQTRSGGPQGLSRSELRELALLYRQVAADLSALREDRSTQNFARSLNLLLARAHNIIYTGQKSSFFEVIRFFRYSYPRIFRRNLRFVSAAFLLFAAGAVIGALLTLTQPQFMHRLLGEGMVETIERKQMWTHSIVSIKPFASSAIMTNNLSVSFTTFAFGMTAGVGTVYMMLMNGLLLGVIGVACWLSGMSLSLWSFVAPHGVLELPAIFIAGGAGLKLAHGLLFPGLLSRRDSLTVAGAEAVRLVVGIIPILIIAGVLEGFLSPSGLSPAWKFSFGAALFCFFAFYLFASAQAPEAKSAAKAMELKTGLK